MVIDTSGDFPGAPVVVVVALHGFASGAHTWVPLARTLQAPLVAYDRAGFATAGSPADSDPVDELWAVLDGHARDGLPAPPGRRHRFVLVGHSAGAGVILAALSRPGTLRRGVAGAVLVAPVIGGGPPAALRRLLGAVPALSRAGAVLTRAAAPLAVRVVVRMRGRPDADLDAAYLRAFRTGPTATTVWRSAGTRPEPVPVPEPAPVPVVIVAPEGDRWASPEAVEPLARRLGAGVVTVPGGHLAGEADPVGVAGVVGVVVGGAGGGCGWWGPRRAPCR